MFCVVAFHSILRGQSLTGKVLGEDGKPASGAEISHVWLLGTGDSFGARAYASARADASGHFTLPLTAQELPADLMIYGEDRRSAAILRVTSTTQPVEVTLHATRRLHLSVEAGSLGTQVHGSRFLLQSSTGRTLAQLFAADIYAPLPQGEYKLSLSSADTISTVQPLKVSLATPESLRFPLHLNAFAIHYGKRPPSLQGLIDAQGNSLSPVRLDKPTLIYFWADWCQPCISEGIPHLLQFSETHKGQNFQIIAVHENGIPRTTTTGTFLQSVNRLDADVWKVPFNFPMTFDATGSVTRNWSLATFPTYALIDQHGILQKDAGLEQLDALLKVRPDGLKQKAVHPVPAAPATHAAH